MARCSQLVAGGIPGSGEKWFFLQSMVLTLSEVTGQKTRDEQVARGMHPIGANRKRLITRSVDLLDLLHHDRLSRKEKFGEELTARNTS
jgi:hypothetical protein